MATVTQVSESIQKILVERAEQCAQETGFIERRRKLTGASFVQTLVFGWLGNGNASLSELNQTAAAVGVEITESGLDQRFGPKAAQLMKAVLEAGVEEVIAADEVVFELLERFEGVHLLDSSTVGLPGSLAHIWPGCGNQQGASASLKIQVDLNFSNGSLEEVWLQAGRKHDLSERAQAIDLPAGALRITDLGYFKLDWLESEAQRGVFWLTRLKAGTNVYDVEGQEFDVGRLLDAQQSDRIDMPILLGSQHKLACRLLAVHVPQQVAAQRRRKLKKDARRKGQTVSQSRLALADWTILITTVPAHLLSLDEAIVLYGVRWQIELLFKLWKSVGLLDKSRSNNPWRILCELYAKLLAMLIQHWIFLTSFWAYPDRSLTKAAKTVQKHAINLALACNKRTYRLREAIEVTNRCLAAGCRMNSRRARPNTYQLLLNCSPIA